MYRPTSRAPALDGGPYVHNGPPLGHYPSHIRLNDRGEPAVTNEPVEFEKYRLKFKTVGNLPIILEESIEYTPI